MSRKTALLTLPIIMALNCLICPAQVEQGAISGVVTDASGAFIAKAKVTATNQATGVVATADTTDEGYYKIPYLLPGSYDVQIEKEGFAASRVTGVPVLVGQTAAINARLRPGTVHEEITVTSDAVMIDQTSASLGYVASSTQIL